MRSSLPEPDPHEARTLSDIAEHGWSGIIIEPDEQEPGFEYTIGFMETLGHPEVIVFGLPTKTAHNVLWQIFRRIRAGRPFTAPRRFNDILVAQPCESRMVDKSQHAWYLGYAMWHHRNVGQTGSLQAMQCVWPDKQGRFPGEPACDRYVEDSQPDLTLYRDDQPES